MKPAPRLCLKGDNYRIKVNPYIVTGVENVMGGRRLSDLTLHHSRLWLRPFSSTPPCPDIPSQFSIAKIQLDIFISRTV